MSSEIKKPYELDTNQPISCMIYGQPGCGKTSLAISSEKPFVLDFDRGMRRLSGQFHCDSLQIEKYQDVIKFLANGDISEYQTIVVDTFGKMIDSMLNYVCEENTKLRQYDGTPSQKAFGAVKVLASSFVSQLFSKNKNIIFIAHEKEEKDDDSTTKRPKAAGQSIYELIQDLDLLGYMEMHGEQRTVSFSPTHKFYAKNSFRLDPVIKIPDNSNGNDFFETHIMQAIRDKRETEKLLRLEYEKLVARHKMNIEHIQNAEDCNAAYQAMKEDRKIWDSETRWKRALKIRTDSLNIVFNPSLGVFEDVISNA